MDPSSLTCGATTSANRRAGLAAQCPPPHREERADGMTACFWHVLVSHSSGPAVRSALDSPGDRPTAPVIARLSRRDRLYVADQRAGAAACAPMKFSSAALTWPAWVQGIACGPPSMTTRCRSLIRPGSHLAGGAQVLARAGAAPPPAQPLPVQQAGAGQVRELCAAAGVNISGTREPNRSSDDDFPRAVVTSPPTGGSGSV
jgi:hypothetical protein